jgi:FkbM family methyltransferase
MAFPRIRSASPDWIKAVARYVLRPEYRLRQREFRRLRRVPRFTPAQTHLLGHRLELVDCQSFESTYCEIFERQVYRFTANSETPFIIDCGANVGLSVVYFKRLYPKSRIIAFEPDPNIFRVLKLNCKTFGFQGVELIPKAVWTGDTVLEFLQEGGEAGRLAKESDSRNIIHVSACKLKSYLQGQPVDLLKLDIEGAETEVLRDCRHELSNVRHLFVEYHSFTNSPQTLRDIISILDDSGFRLHMHSLEPSHQPFIYRKNNCGMDFQANIFAFRA